MLSKTTLFSIYSRKVLKTLITFILLLSITKYLSFDPSIFSTLPNKHLNVKASRYLYHIRVYLLHILYSKYLFQL